MLPAMSSISTRDELLSLQRRLSAQFSTIAVDWPGFGTEARPRIAWSPAIYRTFLRNLLDALGPPAAVIAAGHAAAYAMAEAADRPASLGRLCLLSPTWQGPLPTMMRRRLPLFRWMAKAVDVPVLGEALYRLNVNGPVIGMMTRGHVYEDPARVTAQWMREKRRVTDSAGARHAGFRFVTGELDLFRSQQDYLTAARRLTVPTLAVHAAKMPRKSKAEVIALTRLPNVEAIELPRGKLSFYEEFPDQAAGAITRFLDQSS
ncbi:MAG TPA: alpha/beta hydrolase [Devosiaceae bacterium]|nr:alpha/beta hydrolase [Devosiaceae bacterium]